MPTKGTVIIYATGGTIAGAAPSSTSTAMYQSGALRVDELIRGLPELEHVAEITSQQICNLGSPDLNSEILISLSQQIERDLMDDSVSGVVVTHGTDTIEETAFFLDLTIKSDKPVVLVGSMRPASSLSPDGPMNLLEAVRLASCKDAKGRGTMIVLNDRICSARFTTKINANRVDAFKAGDQGYLGTFENSMPNFFYPPVRANCWRHFDICRLDASKGLPKVNILCGHPELEAELFAESIRCGAKGVVLAGMGAGCWSKDGGKAISKAREEGGIISIIASYRTAYGFVDGANELYGLGEWAIGGGFLNPPKCRIQLQLCLATGLAMGEIRKVFEAR
ncbi:Asparaginase [Fusarium falciforme]|uniref:Asparaginase n=1 Tax=Fusarium falciforme TaxID=195108 RepID=UPI0022FFD3E7|nr:Asparaginase [Fusarium falciforme]KAJ4205245.1 hypothetical protein NW767_004039 [Fusarium falciforme]WAO95202.1 Asparaginase [Fusarium falciforme]